MYTKKVKVIIFMFFVCAFTKAQEQSVTIEDNSVLNELLVKQDSNTNVYKYFIPIKFLKSVVSNVDFINNLYGSCGSLDHNHFEFDKFIKDNKDKLLENIDLSSYTKIKRAGLHNNLKLTSNHSEKGIVYMSKPIYLEDLIFVYFNSKDESKMLFLDKQTLKLVCSKYLYLNLDN